MGRPAWEAVGLDAAKTADTDFENIRIFRADFDGLMY